MSNRNYNVFFNTHTVSGIVISVALYVIFFAGAFALFRDEIIAWENGKLQQNTPRDLVDYDGVINSLKKDYYLTGRDLQINVGEHEDDMFMFLSPTKDTLAPKTVKKSDYFAINTINHKRASYKEKYTLGEFLYRLHFFSQLPRVGIYLAGFVSLFFLFAIVTGVIVHWKKIVSNFYSFNPKIALKRVWTDAHTALGVIGLPFQFMYALTGTYFGLSILVLLPANLLYNNNQQKLIEDIRPERKVYQWTAASTKSPLSLNEFVKTNAHTWQHFHMERIMVKNYGGENMKYLLAGHISDEERFLNSGIITGNAFTGEIETLKSPEKFNYVTDFPMLMGRLHFGEFGGFALRVVYFILSLITCFVIITGVLIWVEARNKKSKTLKQRLYTTKVGHIYMAICLSLFPITAFSFLVVKCLPESLMHQKMTIIYAVYFIGWIVLSVYFRFKRDNYFTNKTTLLSGAILGLLIPIVSGIVSNNWIWNTYKNEQFGVLFVDVFWIILSALALYAYFKINASVKTQSSYTKTPIDYKNLEVKLTD